MRHLLVVSATALIAVATFSPSLRGQTGSTKPADLSGDWAPDRTRGGMGQSLSLSDPGGRKRGNEDDIPYLPWARATTSATVNIFTVPLATAFTL